MRQKPLNAIQVNRAFTSEKTVDTIILKQRRNCHFSQPVFSPPSAKQSLQPGLVTREEA